MDVVLIAYFETDDPFVSKTAVSDKRSGKFVQIRNRTAEYLLLSPREIAPYHADLVERFCRERGLSGSRSGDGKRFAIHDQEWIIVGGGKFELDAGGKYIRFYDDSMAYGRFDPKGLQEKILAMDVLSDYTVDVE